MLKSAVLLSGLIALCLALPASGQDAPRSDIWDVPMGTSVAELDANFLFIDHACGTAGGPPARRLTGFAGFADCRAEPSGWHEVYFRYDDTAEYRARALEQTRGILAHRGTVEYGFPVVASLLIDADGHVRGKRIVSDPRPANATDRARFEFWTLGNLMRNHVAPSGWTCEDEARAAGEEAVGNHFVKWHCTFDRDGLHHLVRQTYLQKRGQVFFNTSTNRYDPLAFESTAFFEVTEARP